MASGVDLIRAMAGGDRDAFARFYDRYASLVYPLILRIVRERAGAADVLQDVFWDAWQNADAHDAARGTPEAWIVMRARTQAIARVRSLRRWSEPFAVPLDDGAVATGTEPVSDPGARAEVRSAVPGVLAQLPAAEREVLELAYYGGLTQTEIAERITQPAGTVQARIRSGLERLRTLVKRRT